MARLRFERQETTILGRRSLVIDDEHDLILGGVLTPDSLQSSPNIVKAPITHRQVGVLYYAADVDVFEGGLQCIARRAMHYFFLTSFENNLGVCTHIDTITSDPDTYMNGMLRENVLRMSSGLNVSLQKEPKLIALMRQAVED